MHDVLNTYPEYEGRLLTDDAMIVFTADHGEELGTAPDGWVGHSIRLSQKMIRVPLMIKMPGQKQGRRVLTPVSLVDLMPTLAKAVGMPIPAGVQGRPIEIGNEQASARPVFAETRREASLDMVVSGRWKLVYDREKQEHRLFDVVAAPSAHDDVSEEHPEVVAALEGERARWNAAQEEASPKREAEDHRAPIFSEEEEVQLRELGYVR